MIIKSMSRKGAAGSVTRGSFYQLYHYINEKSLGQSLTRNIQQFNPSSAQVIGSFIENARNLRQTKRHNLLYHEVICLEKRGDTSQHEMILHDLAQRYLEQRAPGAVAFGTIHDDAENSIHLHLMISANELDSRRRIRLSKQEFSQIQKSLEEYLQKQYPELGERSIYNQPWEHSLNFSDKELNLKRRTKAPSKKDLIKEVVTESLSLAASQEELVQLLAKSGIDLVVRGKTVTVQKEAIKCRLKTIGLLEAYEQLLEKEKDPVSERLRQLREMRTRQKGSEKERSSELEQD